MNVTFNRFAGLGLGLALIAVLVWPACTVDFRGSSIICSPNPCQNGGSCTAWEDSFTCDCAPGYDGPLCDTDIDDCAPNPCQNGGSCTDAVDAYSCQCPAGYSDPTCSTNDDDCDPNPCQNGATCIDGVDSFTCQCSVLWTGTTCEIETCVVGDVVNTECTSNASLVESNFCSRWTDGDEATFGEMGCIDGTPAETSCAVNGTNGCVQPNGCVQDLWIGIDLGSPHWVSGLRFRSDWWSKRPENYEVWVSDATSLQPGNGASFVVSAVGNPPDWVCVDGDSCNPETVPDVCCPNGRDQPQDTVNVGPWYGKYDLLDFNPTYGRYWYLVVNNTYYASGIVLAEITWIGSTCTSP